MKRILLASALLAVNVSVVAEESSYAATSFYVGIKTGSLNIDDGDGYDYDADAPISFSVGYMSEVGAGTVGLEFDYTIADIDISDGYYSATFDYTGLGFYGTYRSAGDVYFKAKLGINRGELEGYGESDSDTETAGGIGIGFRNGNVGFEIEATRLYDDVNFLSAGLTYTF